MRPLIPTLLAMIAFIPTSSSAQGIAGVMSAIQDGGGWVGIPIERGEGSFSTVRLPTARLALRGCVNVWYGHSGSWTIEAHERVAGESLTIAVEPGVAVPFSHDFGMQAQIDFAFRWSEPRDTTLLLWVGVDADGEGGKPPVCQPY